MFIRTRKAWCVFCVAASGCASEPSPAPAERLTEAAVYAAVLDQVYAAEGEDARAVQDSTTFPGIPGVPPPADSLLSQAVARHARSLPGLQMDTQLDFVTRARDPATLPSELPSRVQVTWLSPSVARQASDRIAASLPEQPQWVTLLSRLGFSQDSSQALVYLAELCPGLCGHGEYLLLMRTDGQWQVVARSQDWIA